MLLSRYKEGFERLAIVAFVVCAAGIGLAHLSVNMSYSSAAHDPVAGRALEREMAEQCGPGKAVVFAYLCRQGVVGRHRLQSLRERTGTPTVVVLISAAVLAAGFFAYRTYRWVRQGFVAD